MDDVVQGSILQQENAWFEVLFKRYHVMHFPWGENTEEVPLLSQFSQVPLQNEAIAVKKLYHVTHRVQEREMFREDENCYVFKPKQKHGRRSSSRINTRRSYLCLDPRIDNDTAPEDETLYRLVLENESLFPGFLSWWSIDIPNRLRYDSPSLQQGSKKYYTTNDFKEPPISCYGDVKLSIDLQELLRYYQEARSSSSSSDLPLISIRNGGTLRYKREIMKVIIVCCKDDLPLDDYPLLDTPASFSLEYDAGGKVSTTDDHLTLTIINGIASCSSPERGNCYYSWDTYGFAFYFPTEDFEMKCDKNNVKDEVVDHEKVVGSNQSVKFGACLKKDSFGGNCPSNMPPRN